MKAIWLLNLFLLLSACERDPADWKVAREYAAKQTEQVLCGKGSKAKALHEIAATATAVPYADIADEVYEASSRIERDGCSNVIKNGVRR